jgi:hypothetical protein
MFFALFETVALALDVDDGTVMQDAVKDSGSDGHVSEDLVPLGEGFVGGKDGGNLLVASGNELKEQISALDIHRKIPDFINNKQLVLGKDFELVGQTVCVMSGLELFNKLVAVDVIGATPVAGGHHAEGGGEMRLTDAWRAEEHDVLAVFKESHGCQLIELALIDGGLEAGVEIIVIENELLNTADKTDLEKALISNIVFELLSYLAEKERLKIRSRQAAGIELAKTRGGAYKGRKAISVDEVRFEDVYGRWKGGELTAVRAMDMLGVKKDVFYRLARERAG